VAARVKQGRASRAASAAAARSADVAVLFARAKSNYKAIPGCDVWDIKRDALKWPGGCPVVAHPPCGAWGRLRHFSRPRPGEKDLALWAVEMVRKWGGVLEHPSKSRLWVEAGLPRPGERDEFGGWTLPISQWWWGHRAEKRTLIYVVGCDPRDAPPIPFRIGEASHVIQSRRRGEGHRPHVSKTEREHTPPLLASWLFELARKCQAGFPENV